MTFRRPTRRLEIFAEQEGLCYYCSEPMFPKPRFHHDPEEATLEHITPRALGGTNNPGNLAVAHRKCNEARGIELNMRLHGLVSNE